jgi:Rrf2 family nitric oxide-sensitive transcriptional repressor
MPHQEKFMNLTRFSDYALRVLICAGTHPDRLLTIAEIASALAISENHLMKVVHRLAQLNLLETLRGKGGGLRLAHPPARINLGAVLRQTEQGQPLVECFQQQDSPCRLLPACALPPILRQAEAAFYAELDRHTLADLLHQPGPIHQLIPMH